jgi:hypothetical protein
MKSSVLAQTECRLCSKSSLVGLLYTITQPHERQQVSIDLSSKSLVLIFGVFALGSD